MKIANLDAGLLGSYCKEQLHRIVPFSDGADFGLIDLHLPEALRRLDRCIADARMWQPGTFDVLHSSQYCTFLYYLANTIWRREGAATLCTKLFLLNKQLNAIDLFYEIELPEVFFINHSVGIVLAKATYGNRLVLFQNSTVGRNREGRPVIEEGVILYPNTAVIGSAVVRAGSSISQGVCVINRETRAGHIAYQGAEGGLVFKPDRKNLLSDYFRSA